MADPITIPVRTSAEGLELVEILSRRGLPAALVSLPLHWQVEITTPREPDELLLHEVTVALESSARLLRRSSLPVLVGARRYDLRPHLDVVAPPLRAA
jgi:hypothetical protein